MTAGDAEDEAEHHDYGETVADAGFEVGGIERRALRASRDGVKGEDGGGHEERGQPRTDFRCDVFMSSYALFYFFVSVSGFIPPNHAATSHTTPKAICVICDTK